MINPTKGYRTSTWVIEALQKGQYSTLAPAGYSAKGMTLAGFESKADISNCGIVNPPGISHLDVLPTVRRHQVLDDWQIYV
jgi:hypothetical protein